MQAMESRNKLSATSISQEDKATNPILRVVSNKIRNLTKKLTQIEHIETLDRKTLKTAQINKLNQKGQILQEIRQQEEFAVRYKTLMVENNIVNDKVDDLIRISALLAVGKRIQREQYCPQQTKQVYCNIYDNIFKQNVPDQSGTCDQIVRVYHLLDKYLANPEYYTQCKDYMTYQEEIDQRNKNGKEGNQIVPKAKIVQKSLSETTPKVNKLTLESKVYSFEERSTQLKKQINDLELELTNDKQLSLSHKIDSICKSEQKASTSPDSFHSKPEAEDDLDQDLLTIAKNIRKETFDFSKKDEGIMESNSSSNIGSAQQQKKKKKKNKRKNTHFEIQAVRKCSDTSLEPTPEKFKVKKQKYVEKIQ